MNALRFSLSLLGLSAGLAALGGATGAPDAFVRVSPRDPRYFELSDGRPYIPIGLNLISPGTRDTAEGLARMEHWMEQLAKHGGNFIRVWISSPYWDVEHERSGVYDEAKAARIERMLAAARRHGLRVKLTLEHFREMSDTPRQSWANKPLHLVANGGTATSVPDFFTGEPSRARFRQKLAWLARRFGDDPTIFGWELWNEVNAVRARPEDYLPWTELMLGELHRLFPRHLAMQSLGSYDTPGVRALYRQHSLLPGNDLAQVHRYLDLGAPLEICHGPMDVLAADAVRDLLAFTPGRPVVLAEGGAVEPRHTGPFALYPKDESGVLLHDVLFAPFFAGAAAAGQIWHWDVYVDRNRLWPQFARFAAIVRDLDPAAERFQSVQWTQARLRIYALRGGRTTLLWFRDGGNTWHRELAQGETPAALSGLQVDLAPVLAGPAPRTSAEVYDPWKNEWTPVKLAGTRLALPDFRRSIVVRLRGR